ncbi:MAG: TPM domain-containing protein [Deltaproteobacteria bacterium]|nr:TPM domain-containing protein [Deltaproteobacteria bacterium]
MLLPLILIISIPRCSDPKGDNAFVEDRCGLLEASQLERIAGIERNLLAELDIHFMTIILDAPAADLNAAAVDLFDRHAPGSLTKGARGMLLLIDPWGKAVRLETGYDLEGIFTDAFVGYVEQRQMQPFFAAGRIGPGIEATVELLVDKALRSIDSGDYVVDQAGGIQGGHLSGGAGAKSGMQMGDRIAPKPSSLLAGEFGPGKTPSQTLEKCRQVLELHIKDPDLGIYSPQTREFFRQWVVTDAQQDNARKGLEKSLPAADVRVQGDLAVIRFPVENRGAAPYFFIKGDQGWMIDFRGMNRSIRFNHKNQWHFVKTDHPYMFAFSDLRFDKHGFPHKR